MYEPIAYTADGAAFCPTCALAAFGRCADGDIGCNAHELPADRAEPARASSLGAVFEWQESEFADGGLTCDTCGYEMVESDTCPDCDRSLSSDHETYIIGPAGHTVTVGPLCPGWHGVADIRVRIAEGGYIGVAEELVPFELSAADRDRADYGRAPFDPAEPRIVADLYGEHEERPTDAALDAIVAAYAGTVATFELLGAEMVR